MLAGLSATGPAVTWDRPLFSAKESTYKAWFPLTGRMLDFDGAVLTIDLRTRSFRARLPVDGGRRDGGTPLTGFADRFLTAGGLVLTAIAVPAAPVTSRNQERDVTSYVYPYPVETARRAGADPVLTRHG
jgi:hypothetical protein